MIFTLREKILIALLVLVGICGIATCHYKQQLRKEYDKVLSANDSTKNVMKTYVDENGKLHAQVETADVDKKIYDQINSRQIDSLSRLLKSKPKDINGITSVTTQDNGRFRVPLDSNHYVVSYVAGRDTVHDTIATYEFDYEDRWLRFTGTISDDSLTGTYSITDSLTIVSLQKRSKLGKLDFLHLGPMKTFVDVTSTNPNTRYLNMRDVELKEVKKLNWSVGPYLGYGWNGTAWTPSVGISVQYSLFRF